MKLLAYFVWFVALLQISYCQDDSTTETSPTSTFPTTALNSTGPESNETSESSEPTSEPTSTTTDNEVPDTISYDPAESDSTTDLTTGEGSTGQSTTKPSGQGVLVYPTALVVLVPLCIRLFTINLVGVV